MRGHIMKGLDVIERGERPTAGVGHRSYRAASIAFPPDSQATHECDQIAAASAARQVRIANGGGSQWDNSPTHSSSGSRTSSRY
jgi:hypothetical protein